jgi:hypothetical protein
MATMFNWGEFAIWHLGPRVKVSIDGRRETVYSEEVRRKALDFESGRHEWDAILRDTRSDMALVQAGTAGEKLLRLEPGWVLVHQDRLSRLFVRRESPLRETISRTPSPDLPDDGEGLCFPTQASERRLASGHEPRGDFLPLHVRAAVAAGDRSKFPGPRRKRMDQVSHDARTWVLIFRDPKRYVAGARDVIGPEGPIEY